MSSGGRGEPTDDAAGLTLVDLLFLLEHGVSASVLAEARRDAITAGVSLDRALIACGHVGEDDLYRALARTCGLPFVSAPRLAPASARAEVLLAAAHGMAASGESCRFVAAPTGIQIKALLRASARGKGPPGLALTSPSRFSAAVIAASGPMLARDAAHALPDRDPGASYRDEARRGEVRCLLGLEGVVFAAIGAFPAEACAALHVVVGLVLLAFIAMRTVAMVSDVTAAPSARSLPDVALPTYAVLVPLHREGTDVVSGLCAALHRLDYPPAKLDVMFLVEEGDEETRRALARVALPRFGRVVICPPGHPRTKPRALNIGLALSSADLVVVYDAEDRPDADQLRLAASRFSRLSPRVGCLQAGLAIHNRRDGWIARLFGLEYAILFTLVIPGLSQMALPIPLGGTSNHFRRDALVRCGGWDAWNVTEDADMGFRLHRAGIQVASLASCTWEEAPVHLIPWFNQRRRWFKGWIQTALVHRRRRRTGFCLPASERFMLLLQAVGTVLSVMVYPLFLWTGFMLLAGRDQAQLPTWLGALAGGSAMVVLATGVMHLVLAVTLAARRGAMRIAPLDLVLGPLYLVLMSLAAWWALADVVRDPFHWAKTAHGRSARRPCGSRGSARVPLPSRPGSAAG